MTKHLLIVGAGPGLALSTARRFGREGYSVSLVGRTPERLAELESLLAGEGIAVSTYRADASDHTALREQVYAIAGVPVDVCIFQPGGTAATLVDVRGASVENVRPNLELFVLGAVAVAEVLAPSMEARGSGSLIFVGGGSARATLPYFGNLSPAMAGLRSFAMTLGKALAGSGVHAGFLTVAGMIAPGEPGADEIDPVMLADRLWRLAEEQSPLEVVVTSAGEIPVKQAS